MATARLLRDPASPLDESQDVERHEQTVCGLMSARMPMPLRAQHEGRTGRPVDHSCDQDVWRVGPTGLVQFPIVGLRAG